MDAYMHPTRNRTEELAMSTSHFKIALAACLLCLSLGAHARDGDSNGGWRLGHGHDHYGIYRWDGWNWRRMPGTATDVGDGWVIGTDRRSGGYGIYRWSGRDWRRVPGGAVKIGGSFAQPWIINNRGEQFFWNGYDWDEARRGKRRWEQDHRGNSFKPDRRDDRSDRHERGRW